MATSLRFAVLLASGLMALASGAVEYVIESGDVVALTNAFAELNKAGTTNARLLLKPGVYDLSGTIIDTSGKTPGSHFRLDKKMKGGLIAGTGDTPGETIIKGGGETDKLRLFHFWMTDSSSPMVISNLTLTGGYSNSDGGAVFGSNDSYGGNLVLSHVIVSNNYAKVSSRLSKLHALSTVTTLWSLKPSSRATLSYTSLNNVNRIIGKGEKL